jgi:hypothetical protein
MKYTLILSILLLSFYVHAQEAGYLPGAIITTDDERLEGLVKNVNMIPARILEDIKFKRAEGEKVQVYSPSQLLGYESDGNIFVSKKLENGQKMFVRKFNTGKLRLYGGLAFTGDASYTVTFVPYIQLEGDPVIHLVQQLAFKKQMLSYLKDAPELCKLISDKTLKRKDIEEIVNLYNEEVQKVKATR